MKKRLLLGGGLVVCVAVLVLLIRIVVLRPGVTAGNFYRLHEGMREEAVEAIMGGPGTDEWPIYFRHGIKCWKGENCEVSIEFDEGDRVMGGKMLLFNGQTIVGMVFLGKDAIHDRPGDRAPSALERVYRWIGSW